jgi:hypothetical protein
MQAACSSPRTQRHPTFAAMTLVAPDALEPYPPSYLVIGFLRLLVQFKPNLITVVAVVKRHVREP